MRLHTVLLQSKTAAVLLATSGLLLTLTTPTHIGASDQQLLNRLAGKYASRMNTELYAFDVGEPVPEMPSVSPVIFTGDVRLPNRKGGRLKGKLSLGVNGDYLLSSRITKVRCKRNRARYFGNIMFKSLDDTGLGGTYTGRLRATASTRGQRREKLTFRVKLTRIVPIEGPEPDQIFLLLGKFNGTK